MFKNKYIKLTFIVFLLFAAVTVAYAQFGMFKLMGYQNSNSGSIDNNDKLKSQSSKNSEVKESDSPVYFSIFKFVNNVAPAKQGS